MSLAAPEPDPLEQATESFLARLRAGERPALGEYEAKHPELAADIRELFPALVLLEQGRRCVDQPPAPDPTRLGEGPVPPQLGEYLLLREIGRGGMGVVYKVYDRRLKRFGALKMVRPDRPVRAEDLARLRAEAEALARLQHRHIVQVFASGEHAGQPYFVQEFVAGGSLQHKVRGRPQEPREAIRLVRLLARAVHAAHGCGIIHRDLKPANVLLASPSDEPALNTAYGCPKVADFGLARYLDGTQEPTATGVGVGTPSYMAPEQTRGDSGAVGPATDVWALGAMLYELLTGQVPFHGRSALETLERIRTQAPEPPRRLRPEVPAELEAICLRCLEKSPSDRYASAAALAEDLSRWLEGRPAPRPPHPSAAGRRLLLMGAALGVVVALVAVFARGWFGTDPDRPQPDPRSGDRGPSDAKALRITRFQVRHYARQAGSPLVVPRGVLGEKSFAVRFNDQVRLEVALNQKAYLYLLAFNADGKEQLLWPQQGPPPALSRLDFPTDGGNAWTLDDEPQGGLQAFVVVASARALPAYAEWTKGRPPRAWQRLPVTGKEELVWCGNGQWLDEISPGGVRRGREEELGGVGMLLRLARPLRQSPGVDDVSLVACPVWPQGTR
jgi:serine/threonine-protein kinase